MILLIYVIKIHIAMDKDTIFTSPLPVIRFSKTPIVAIESSSICPAPLSCMTRIVESNVGLVTIGEVFRMRRGQICKRTMVQVLSPVNLSPSLVFVSKMGTIFDPQSDLILSLISTFFHRIDLIASRMLLNQIRLLFFLKVAPARLLDVL